MIKFKCVYNCVSGLRVSCRIFVFEEKNLDDFFLLESLKRNYLQKVYTSLWLYICSHMVFLLYSIHGSVKA